MCLVAAQLSQSEKTKTLGGRGQTQGGEGGGQIARLPDCQIAIIRKLHDGDEGLVPVTYLCSPLDAPEADKAQHDVLNHLDDDALACIVTVVFVLYA